MKHDGMKAYDQGCRCEPCRVAHNDRVRRSRAHRLATGELNHGTRSAYDAGCRCEACLEVRRARYQVEAQQSRRAGENP